MEKIPHQELTQYQDENGDITPRQKHNLAGLTTAALMLPGLLPAITQAADEDSVDFQYSHYQEGKRDIYGMFDHDNNLVATSNVLTKIPQNLNPIEVDSVHGSGRFSLTDRIKFSFNYLQDTWSGATPIGTAPAVTGKSSITHLLSRDFTQIIGIVGASPCAECGRTAFVDNKLNFYQGNYKLDSGVYGFRPGAKSNQLTHVLSYASPETRQQGDFKLSYQWDEASLSLGGGISTERDYESRFVNLGGSFHFNQKQTTLGWGLSFTNSDTQADLDSDLMPFYNWDTLIGYSDDGSKIIVNPDFTGKIDVDEVEGGFFEFNRFTILGKREDWGGQLNLTQVLDKNSLLELGLSYTRSTGYLSNPYKLVYSAIILQPEEGRYSEFPAELFLGGHENRPGERNQFNWHIGYDHYFEPLDAALHFDYQFAHDDWSINAHTFEADWVQPLGAGWTVTPRIRYYSQSAADFYAPYFISVIASYDPVTNEPYYLKEPPKYFSSDQRLSGFGTLSGGVTVEKQFAKGVSLETGFEYYTHQGGLKIGGGGEQNFADFDYWVANAALKVNLAAVGVGDSHAGHGESHHHHSNVPAGVMFDHALPKAGDFMAGYRYMRSEQAGDMVLGNRTIPIAMARTDGCGNRDCAVTPDFMAMNMHMLDLMVAPTDWLTFMLMPQWMNMDMVMTANPNAEFPETHGGHQQSAHHHETGGIGDTGLYALFKAFDHQHHHLTLSLGGTAPTGDVDITLRRTASNPVYSQKIHYGMQLGSGTWDFKPALTYTGNYDNLLWGAQANATIRLESRNESGYALGDIFQGSIWGGYQWTNWLATTVRGIYSSQGKIQGAYPASTDIDSTTGQPYVYLHNGPFDEPANYGGEFVDLGLGVNVTVPSGALAGNSLKFEWLQPVHTDYNGYQLDRDYAVNFTWSYGF